MMAAAQPFISGAISKTINLPNDATLEDIKNSYELSWKLGLKANALYRDGSKLSQPLEREERREKWTKTEEEDEDAVALPGRSRQDVAGRRCGLRLRAQSPGIAMHPSDNIADARPHAHDREDRRTDRRAPARRGLPDTRQAMTHNFDVAGHEGYITVGLYEDGQPGEVFIRIAKEGSTIGGLMDTIATLVSRHLQ